MKGRDKCELLNEIRQKIADANDIEFTIYECTFEGDCTGTCPKCESEREYLEKELEKKQNAGEKIKITGLIHNEDTEEFWATAIEIKEMRKTNDDLPKTVVGLERRYNEDTGKWEYKYSKTIKQRNPGEKINLKNISVSDDEDINDEKIDYSEDIPLTGDLIIPFEMDDCIAGLIKPPEDEDERD